MSLPLILLCVVRSSSACSRDDDMRCGLPLGSCYLDIDLIALRAIPFVFGYIGFYASAFGAVDVSAFTRPTLFFIVRHTRPTLQVDVVLLVGYP